MAGNQLGKTIAGGMETAMHLTGLYPDWWPGMVFEKATSGWAASNSAESTRDNPQRILLGETEELWGTGAIPKRCIKKIRRGNLPGSVAFILVQHVSGGISKVAFKSYEQGREKWQGPTLDWLWPDEEPPIDIYSEGLTRTNNGQKGQFAYITYTPLLGMSDTTNRFLSTDPAIRGKFTHVTKMGIADADHYTEEQKAQIIASYPLHEREARANGTPILGSGRVFQKAEDEIKIEPFSIPQHWARINGVDFGWDHPAALASLAYDRDTGTVYVVSVWRKREAKISEHCSAIRATGVQIPVAWPHDGLQHEKSSGQQLAEQYKAEGISMLTEKASFPETIDGKSGGNSVEAGIMLMSTMMDNGKLKVFSTCVEFFEEYGMYHRKDGIIVKERDDIICAVRYAIMMLRFAEAPKQVYGHSGGKSLTIGGWDDRFVV